VVKGRRGTFTVELDNRFGAEPLQVQLSAADEFGRAGFSFAQAAVAVPPGQVSRVPLAVEHPRPAAGTSASRRVQVTATGGAGSVADEAVFTQQVSSYRRLWAVLLVLLGALLVVVGVVMYADTPPIEGAEGSVRSLVDAAGAGRMPDEPSIRVAVAVVALALALLCVAFMLLGLTGRSGKAIRAGAIVAGLCGVAATVSLEVAGGVVLVVAGAVLAFVGGVLARQT
jgi:hypothetical protein